MVFFGNTGGHIPKTIISSINGVLRDSDNHIVSQEIGEQFLRREEKYVIKKTVAISSRRDVKIVKSGPDNSVKLLASFGNNYIV